jgi:hypothetical protein
MRPSPAPILFVLSCGLALAGCARQARTEPVTAPVCAATAAPPADRVEHPDTRAAIKAAGLDPDRIQCNTQVRWETRLDGYAEQIARGLAEQWGQSLDPASLKKARHFVLGYLVRSHYQDTRRHNLGVLALRGRSYPDEKGQQRPLLVFRSGLMFGASGGTSECFGSLVRDAHVRHIVNLYTGTFPLKDLIAAEEKLASDLGASYFDSARVPEANWRQDVEDESAYRKNLPKVMGQIASLIRAQILSPGGKPPRGNVYFHCAGGMHRSGMIFALLRRCVNQDAMELVEAEYKRHVGWRSDAEPGGFEALNLRLVRDFDCSLLAAP